MRVEQCLIDRLMSDMKLARQHIKHIIFVIKENRTFDNLYARYPGADGATQGTTCDGQTVTLGRSPDRVPDSRSRLR